MIKKFITSILVVVGIFPSLSMIYLPETNAEEIVQHEVVVAKNDEKCAASPESLPNEGVSHELLFTEEDVAMVAKTLYGECRGCSAEEQAQIVWCILNRVDDPRFPDTISDVITQPYQFHGYSSGFPVWDSLADVARDVLTRWSYEKQGIAVERELAPEYVFFTGNGTQNIFRTVY